MLNDYCGILVRSPLKKGARLILSPTQQNAMQKAKKAKTFEIVYENNHINEWEGKHTNRKNTNKIN